MPGRVTRSRASAANSGVEVKSETPRSIKKENLSSKAEKPAANSSRKRKRDVKVEDGVAESHGQQNGQTPNGKKAKGLQAAKDMAKAPQKQSGAQKSKSGAQRKDVTKAKKSKYALKSGESPFPNFNRPTPEECQNVKDILAKAHGDVVAPKTIPQPSLTSSGCGQVPSVLDALIRTRLSAATNNQNSSRAFKGLVEKFGLIEEGIGKGSVNWNRVRLAPQMDVFNAIQSGGLAHVKSRDIKEILDMVYEETQQRGADIEKGSNGNETIKKEGDEEERKEEVQKAKEEVLSLDHLHRLSNDDAFEKLIQYPGIGPKTASCVLLFCMQRASFAVDTHVFRLTKWLGWVPTKPTATSAAKARSGEITREKAYAHLDTKIPEDLKYPLHVLLIKHGRNCGWCQAKVIKAARVGTCPLAHLKHGKGRGKETKEMKDEDTSDTELTEDDGSGGE